MDISKSIDEATTSAIQTCEERIINYQGKIEEIKESHDMVISLNMHNPETLLELKTLMDLQIQEYEMTIERIKMEKTIVEAARDRKKCSFIKELYYEYESIQEKLLPISYQTNINRNGSLSDIMEKSKKVREQLTSIAYFTKVGEREYEFLDAFDKFLENKEKAAAVEKFAQEQFDKIVEEEEEEAAAAERLAQAALEAERVAEQLAKETLERQQAIDKAKLKAEAKKEQTRNSNKSVQQKKQEAAARAKEEERIAKLRYAEERKKIEEKRIAKAKKEKELRLAAKALEQENKGMDAEDFDAGADTRFVRWGKNVAVY